MATSVSTFPIENLNFPTVTVCPPRDTDTSLNIFLEMAEKMVLDNKTREELVEFFYQNALEIGYDELYLNTTKFLETDGLRKWYNGLSEIRKQSPRN